MKTKIEETIKIPEGISVELKGNTIIIKKDEKVIERKINGNFNIKIEENQIILSHEKATKKEKKQIKTMAAHIKNAIKGMEKNFVYKLQICYVHFPMNVSIRGNEVVIKNFLGEKKERIAKILPGVNVKIEGDVIIVESYDKEKAGQTAANIELATKIKNRDRRVFQDGIFIIEKAKGRKEK